jgi:hypothetical protein
MQTTHRFTNFTKPEDTTHAPSQISCDTQLLICNYFTFLIRSFEDKIREKTTLNENQHFNPMNMF